MLMIFLLKMIPVKNQPGSFLFFFHLCYIRFCKYVFHDFAFFTITGVHNVRQSPDKKL